MYYKAIFNGHVVDVLDHLTFVKYQPKHGIFTLCHEDEAQGFLSGDGERVWHTEDLYRCPAEGVDTVTLVEIDKYEYERLKILNCKTADEIIDAYTLDLLKGGVL